VSARDDYDPMGFYVEDLARDECERMFDEIDRLRGLVAELADPDPCHYDHHDLCQAHRLDPRPCPHERANALAPD
jgi:hypothetical protein